MSATTTVPPASKPRLLEQVHLAMRSRHYSRRTEQSYIHWIRRFIRFHQLRHPTAGKGLRYQDRARTPRAQGRKGHDDLHPCPQPGRQGRQAPCRGFVEEHRWCAMWKPYITPSGAQRMPQYLVLTRYMQVCALECYTANRRPTGAMAKLHNVNGFQRTRQSPRL